MASTSSKGKGKDTSAPSLPSIWSQWEWDVRGFWSRYRENGPGNYEWNYDVPPSQTSAAAGDELTGSASQPIMDTTRRASFTGSEGSNNGYYTSSSQVTFTTEDERSDTTTPVPMASWPNQSSAMNANTGVSVPRAFNGNSPWPGYGRSPLLYNTSSLESIEQNIQRLDFNDSNMGLILEHQQANEGLGMPGAFGVPWKTIKRKPFSADVEDVDRRYRVIPPKESRDFWRFGRVFMMLWTEPAGHSVGRWGGTRNGSQISTISVGRGEHAFSEIRRFVVIKDDHGFCQCLAIHTYSSQGTLKQGLRDAHNHAIIYTSGNPPGQLQAREQDGTITMEQLTKDPIKVDSHLKGKEGVLVPSSRIHYAKIYTVEKNCRVLGIGMVAKKSRPALESDSPLKSCASGVNAGRKTTRDKHKNHSSGAASGSGSTGR